MFMSTETDTHAYYMHAQIKREDKNKSSYLTETFGYFIAITVLSNSYIKKIKQNNIVEKINLQFYN